MGFVRFFSPFDFVSAGIAPQRADPLYHPFYRSRIGVFWPEIPGLSKLRSLFIEALGQKEISGQRFKDMLPWPSRKRIADADLLSLEQGADTIRDEAVGRPIPPPITFPDRAVARATPWRLKSCRLKKESR